MTSSFQTPAKATSSSVRLLTCRREPRRIGAIALNSSEKPHFFQIIRHPKNGWVRGTKINPKPFLISSPARWQIVLRCRFRVPAWSLKTDELGIPSFFAMARPEYPSFRNGNLTAVYAQRRPAPEFDRALAAERPAFTRSTIIERRSSPPFPSLWNLAHGKKIEAKAKETLFTPKPDSMADRCAGGRATRLRERGRRSPAAGPTPEAAGETINRAKGFPNQPAVRLPSP